ncbi:hypothetical protein BDK51DRAFT_44922 [Blyttiomyces helicus]|uniref:Peptidase A1 domain-containing protein n=1 Tax=Blyttiomyces helicus TaxID=388810 RepID=A0A4P9WIT7_9FUNG|nr:hypothetical protein BDK51DRAFT_44922 [Blyttiomyces helicus]|eukprot:RKO90486.1 hypothetical protein BDK51DRAFT_44922 [Blyttiomyces helicus]
MGVGLEELGSEPKGEMGTADRAGAAAGTGRNEADRQRLRWHGPCGNWGSAESKNMPTSDINEWDQIRPLEWTPPALPYPTPTAAARLLPCSSLRILDSSPEFSADIGHIERICMKWHAVANPELDATNATRFLQNRSRTRIKTERFSAQIAPHRPPQPHLPRTMKNALILSAIAATASASPLLHQSSSSAAPHPVSVPIARENPTNAPRAVRAKANLAVAHARFSKATQTTVQNSLPLTNVGNQFFYTTVSVGNGQSFKVDLDTGSCDL